MSTPSWFATKPGAPKRKHNEIVLSDDQQQALQQKVVIMKNQALYKHTPLFSLDHDTQKNMLLFIYLYTEPYILFP